MTDIYALNEVLLSDPDWINENYQTSKYRCFSRSLNGKRAYLFN